MRDGKGTLSSHNGSVFTGKWYQDKKHGTGEMMGPDKQVFMEQWKYGVLVTRKPHDDQRKAVNTSRLNNSIMDPMRPESGSGFLDQTETSQSNSFMFGNQDDKTIVQNEVTQFIGERPDVGEWLQEKV